MAKKILVITGSPRKYSNSTLLAQWVAEGARELDAEVVIADVMKLEKKYYGCSSCWKCAESKEFRCVIKDDVSEIVASIPDYDVLVLATPVYFFNFSSQIKQVLDRFNSLMKPVGEEYISAVKNIRMALVACAGAGEDDSGVEVLKLSMKYMSEFMTGLKADVFFKGYLMGDSRELEQDENTKTEAIAFGRRLAE